MARIDQVTVRSFKDDEMAGLPRNNRERGKWFIHSITDDIPNLVDIVEDKEEAIEIAEDKIDNQEEDGTTHLVVKDLESEIEKEKVIDHTTMTPEED